ncbi:MAG TPA: hypothetical protein VJX23_01760 [Candidatus Binataceae bacterium]|nr:hypothetical protein [Candidatus Binataceae bacterium]
MRTSLRLRLLAHPESLHKAGKFLRLLAAIAQTCGLFCYANVKGVSE